jgi:hypothetical protein
MKNFLLLTLAFGWFTAGCGWDRATAPRLQEPSWGLVRFHETIDGPEAGYVDLTVRPDGELTLADGRGNAPSSRGLLAGEKLETLARLVDALPPQSYAPLSPCTPDGFFVSVTRGGEVLTFASGTCDAGCPESLSGLSDLFHGLAAELGEPRTQPVPFRVLLRGTASAVHVGEREIVRDRDAFVALLARHCAGGPVAVPRIDFGTEMVVAEFLGDRPSGGYFVDASAVERTESGWMRISFDEVAPGPSCPVTQGRTQPFVVLAVQRQDGDVLFSSSSTETCANPIRPEDVPAGREP